MKKLKDLFLKNEIKKLIHSHKNQVIVLCIVFTLLIIALNQSIYGLKRIDERYNNPFTKYIQVNLPTSAAEGKDINTIISGIKSDFGKKEVLERFHLNGYNELRFEFLHFINPFTRKGVGNRKARSYKFNDELYKEVTNPASSNLIRMVDPDSSLFDQIFEDGLDSATLDLYSVIITENLCQELDLDPYSVQVVPYRIDQDYVLLPVRAVVKALPQFCDILISQPFAQLYHSDKDWFNYSKGLQFSVISPSNSDEVTKKLSDFAEFKSNTPEVSSVRMDDKHTVNIYRYNLDAFIERDTLAQKITLESGKTGTVYPARFLSFVDFDETDVKYAGDFLEFRFQNLDSIIPFQKYCKETYNMETDMQIINIKHLFGEMAGISKMLGAGFLLFSILMLGIFTNNFISRHIEDIKPNLGTLLAYGMPVKLINNTYLTLIMYIYGFALLVGLSMSLIVSAILYWVFKIQFTWEIWVVLGLLTVIGITLWYAKSVISKIFKNTPGDLIYKR